MKRRRILAVTGCRSDYGPMRPIYRKVAAEPELDLQLMVTGLHLLPEFRDSLAEVRSDSFAPSHVVSMLLGEEGGRAMAQGLGLGTYGAAACIESVAPDIVLLQGDRGDMLATAIAASHMNVPIVHMSGGDQTGTIDQPIRNAISQFAHVHLTTCAQSTERLLSMGEGQARVFQVGEPNLDVIRTMGFEPPEVLDTALDLDFSRPVLLATLHPVTTEFNDAPGQMRNVLDALDSLAIQTVFTYPNADAGGREMMAVLESFRDRPWLRIVPSLGSLRYLSLMRTVSALVGNSSSGLLEAPSFRLPAVNIGTRQHGRLRASNVIDVGYGVQDILRGLEVALGGAGFRKELATCSNPYGDGHAAERTVRILASLELSPLLVAKWLPSSEQFVAAGWDEV